MDDVIQEAGMSSSTIYRYLPGGKQELICSVCTWRIDKLAACLDQLRQETDPPGIRDALVSALASLHEDDPDTDFTTTARLAVNAWSEMTARSRVPREDQGVLRRYQIPPAGAGHPVARERTASPQPGRDI